MTEQFSRLRKIKNYLSWRVSIAEPKRNFIFWLLPCSVFFLEKSFDLMYRHYFNSYFAMYVPITREMQMNIMYDIVVDEPDSAINALCINVHIRCGEYNFHYKW